MIANLTELINSLLVRFGQWAGAAFKWIVSGFFQVTQWIAEFTLSFASGLLAELISLMPGISNEQAIQTCALVRAEVAKWNYIFPVYETVVCLNALFTFKIVCSLYRSFMTILETSVHAKQLLLFKKIGLKK